MRTLAGLKHYLSLTFLYKHRVYTREGIGRCVLFTQRFRRKGYAHLMVYAWQDEQYGNCIPIHYIVPEELASLLRANTSDSFLAIASAMSMRRAHEEWV